MRYRRPKRVRRTLILFAFPNDWRRKKKNSQFALKKSRVSRRRVRARKSRTILRSIRYDRGHTIAQRENYNKNGHAVDVIVFAEFRGGKAR